MRAPVKMGFAALLLVTIVALTGLALVRYIFSSGHTASAESQPETMAETVQINRVSNSDTVALSGNAETAPTSTICVTNTRSLAAKLGPSVVTVVNTRQVTEQVSGAAQPALGSGVILNSRGYIVTNYHIVANQSGLDVIFSDGIRASANLIGSDRFTDLAVLKVSSNLFTPAHFGDSDKLKPGQPVVAIGSLLTDITDTLTLGAINAIHQTLDGDTCTLNNLIRTDAIVSQANSGGPLVDLDGTVIGINTAPRLGASLAPNTLTNGYAIPANTVQAVCEQIIRSGSITRPYLGVSYMQITPQVAAIYNLPRQSGLLVSEVAAGGPSAKAGLQPGNIIVKCNGTDVDTGSVLVDMLLNYKVGDSVRLSVVPSKGGTEQQITVKLEATPNQ